MTLSIVTINYNNLEGLRKTIDSVLSQTWHDFEWIIIDGGSTDGSKELIEETANKLAASDFNPLSYWCSEPDKGIYNAMNKGIAKARGEYVNFMNSGDLFYEYDTLKRVFCKPYSAEIIYGNVCYVNDKSEKIYAYPSPVNIFRLYFETICHQAFFTKTEILKDSPYDESYKLCADHAKLIEMAINFAVFEYVPIEICKYDTSGLSYTRLDIIEEEVNRIHKTLFPPTLIALIDEHRILHDRNIYKAVEITTNGGVTKKIFNFFISFTIFIDKIKKNYFKI